MRGLSRLYFLVTTSLALFAAAQIYSAAQPGTPPDSATAQFTPYEFLIGEWDVKAKEDGPPAATIRVKWGPNRSYIWYASTLIFGGREMPHLEGMLVWNAV